MKKRLFRLLTPLLLTLPLLSLPAAKLHQIPQCSFIIQSKKSLPKGAGSINNLILINCNSNIYDLPNTPWLERECNQYKTDKYPTVMLESDDHKKVCDGLAGHYLQVQPNHAARSSEYWVSKKPVASSFTKADPVVRKFPNDFNKQ